MNEHELNKNEHDYFIPVVCASYFPALYQIMGRSFSSMGPTTDVETTPPALTDDLPLKLKMFTAQTPPT